MLTLQISQCPNPALPKPVACSVLSPSPREVGPQEYWNNKNAGSSEVCTAIPAQLTLFFKGNSSRLAALQAVGLRMLRERGKQPRATGKNMDNVGIQLLGRTFPLDSVLLHHPCTHSLPLSSIRSPALVPSLLQMGQRGSVTHGNIYAQQIKDTEAA